jgi:sugar transferase (PEP-CTERM system associated)
LWLLASAGLGNRKKQQANKAMLRFFGQYVPVKTFILVATEVVMIVASIWIAGWIRLGDVDGLTYDIEIGYSLPIRLGAVVLVCLICFYYNDLYDLQVVSRRAELLIRLIQSLGGASLILALLYYLFPGLTFGRGISGVAALLIWIVLMGWRLTVDTTGSFFRPDQRLLVAGTGQSGIRLVQELLRHPELNFKVLGFLDERGENLGKSLVNPGIIGGVADLEEVVQREHVDRVVLSFEERRGQMPVQKLLRVKFSGTKIEDAHSLYEKLAGRIMLERLSPSWLILSEGFRKSSLQLVVKRVLDVVISSVGLMVTLPLSLLTVVAIYLESGKPILFRQERIGLQSRRFQMLKFRSMRQESETNAPTWAFHGDSRITRVGRLIRRFRVDEIPQVINVLRGDMSIVGPRPEQPGFVDMLEKTIPYYAQRHTLRPGITGWAQIKYQYGSSTDDAKIKLEYELFYIKHMSVFLDLLIMVRTFQVVLFGLGAV